MKKILLLNTPFYRLMGSHYNGLSLGILYIAAVLRENGYSNVGVLNADYENRSDYLDQKGIFNGFDLYKTIHEDKNHYIWEKTVDEIMAFNPEFLGITMYTANFKAVKIIAEKVKERNNNIQIVVGGAHPTLAPHDTIKIKEFDYIIVGDGEFPFLRLVNGEPKEKIAGLGYKKNNNEFINLPAQTIHDLNILPFPARDLIINPTSNTDYGQLVTGRGCPFSCTYCASPAMSKMSNNNKLRLREVNNVLDELISIKKNYPHNVIYFEDDTFTMKKERTLELCRKIIENDLNIKWKCDTRADCVSDDMVSLMKKAGCVCIKIGVETGSERMLKKINKRVNKETILHASNVIKNHNVPLTVYLMAGFPGETDDDLKDTINFAKKIDANYYSLSIAAPYFGTKIYDDFVKNNGSLDKEHWEYFYHQSKEMVMNDQLSFEVVEEFLSLNDGKNRI